MIDSSSTPPTTTTTSGHAIAIMLGAQARSNKATVLFVGAVVFMAVFVGLVYNHLDYWSATAKYAKLDTRSTQQRTIVHFQLLIMA